MVGFDKMKMFYFLILFLACLQSGMLTQAEDNLLNGKHWPVNYFNQYEKLSIKDKDKILIEIDKKLKGINKSGEGLIVKGTIAEKIRPDKQIYGKMTICDESGLIVMVNNVPNIYYNFMGPQSKINNNTYMIIKNAKINTIDSYLLNSFVIEGDYHAFVQKFVEALLKEVTNAPTPESSQKVK
jgi:hypothetical protein